MFNRRGQIRGEGPAQAAVDAGGQRGHTWESFPERRQLAGGNSCVSVPPGSAVSHNSLWPVTAAPIACSATAAVAFNWLLPSPRSDGRVSNDCRLGLMPLITVALRQPSCCQGSLAHLAKRGAGDAWTSGAAGSRSREWVGGT